MRIIPRPLLAVSLCFCCTSVFAQSACDLNQDGTVNVLDVQLAVDMSLGLQTCTANLEGPGICNTDVVSRITATALGGSCDTHYAALSWTASTSSNISGYNVYRGNTTGGPYTKLNTSLVVGTGYMDPSTAAGQTYYYVTTAVNSANAESSYSNESVAVIPGNTHYASLNWTSSTSSNITGYNVYRGSTTGGPYTKLNTSLVAGTSYTDPSAAAGQTYYYVTTAVNNTNAESSYSNESKAVIPTP